MPHVFQAAGLGLAPFKYVGLSEGAATCDYCGTPLRYRYTVRSADGREFIVGSDCILKTGDAGLVKAYRGSPEYKRKAREARERKAAKLVARWEAIMADPQAGAVLDSKELELWGCTAQARRYWLARWERSPASGRPLMLANLEYYLRKQGVEVKP